MFADQQRIHRPEPPKEPVRCRRPWTQICAEARKRCATGTLIVMLSDRYLEPGKLPVHALLATGAVHHLLVSKGLRCDCQHRGRNRHRARSASLRLSDRLRRDRRLSRTSRTRALHDLAARGNARPAPATRPQLSPRHPQGLVQDPVEDGHIDDLELSRRAAVRDRRLARGNRLALLQGHRQSHPGRKFRGLADDQRRWRKARGSRASRCTRAAC